MESSFVSELQKIVAKTYISVSERFITWQKAWQFALERLALGGLRLGSSWTETWLSHSEPWLSVAQGGCLEIREESSLTLSPWSCDRFALL